jgi:hypothetical protein
MEADILGTQGVLNLIEQSGHSKFIIVRPNAGKNSIPVFDLTKSRTNQEAKQKFSEWATAMNSGSLNSNVYEIVLFTDTNTIDDDTEQRAKGKQNKIRFTFCLNPRGFQQMGSLNGEPKNVAEMVDMAVKNAMLERDKQDLERRMNEMQQAIDNLSNDDDDDDDDDEQPAVNGQNDLVELLQRSGIISALLGVKTNNPQPVMNGIDTPQAETATKLNADQIKNIQTAIAVLKKHDSEIDKDLLKLAAIAENNPDQFKFLLSALRNM